MASTYFFLFSLFFCGCATGNVQEVAEEQTRSALSATETADVPLSADLFGAEQMSERAGVWNAGVWEPYPPIVQGGDPPIQNPPLAAALAALKNNKNASSAYPQLDHIPAAVQFGCDKVHQAGFYADPETGCQVFRRCDLNGGMTSYLCPIQTIFNQITLSCDWYYNVDCLQSVQFYDYSNSRLYHQGWPLLEGGQVEDNTEAAAQGALHAIGDAQNVLIESAQTYAAHVKCPKHGEDHSQYGRSYSHHHDNKLLCDLKDLLHVNTVLAEGKIKPHKCLDFMRLIGFSVPLSFVNTTIPADQPLTEKQKIELQFKNLGLAVLALNQLAADNANNANPGRWLAAVIRVEKDEERARQLVAHHTGGPACLALFRDLVKDKADFESA